MLMMLLLLDIDRERESEVVEIENDYGGIEREEIRASKCNCISVHCKHICNDCNCLRLCVKIETELKAVQRGCMQLITL